MRLAVVCVAALLAAGCGSSVATRTAQSSGALGFSHCMRSHGISRFPDPTAGGGVPKVGLDRLGVSAARFQAAQTACRSLLPNGGQPPDQAEIQHVREIAVLFAQCVRRHGVANFPDPGSDGRIPDPATAGIDQGSRRFEAANDACAKYRPPYMPSNAAYNAWARTHG